MIWQMFSPWKVSSCSPYSIIGVYFRAHEPGTAVPTSSNKQGLLEMQKKDNWTTFGFFTCSPFVKKLVQSWWFLGVARSGRDSRYLPSESYLGQKEDDGDNDDLNTCPPSHVWHCKHQNPQLWGSHLPSSVHTLTSHYFEESAATHLNQT